LGRYDDAEPAYRRAIEIDPKYASPWNGLGNLLCDFLGRYEEAGAAFAEALRLDPKQESAKQNRVFLERDFLGRIDKARELFAEIEPTECVDCHQLQHALFAAYDQNWGIASGHLSAALDLVPNGLPSTTVDDWIRATAVLLHLGFGGKLLELLRARGDDQRLRPWYEATSAHVAGARAALQNVAVEVRSMAEWFFDQIAKRRNALPTEAKSVS
jgi:tetratricopeptide (TPR) repeat protein